MKKRIALFMALIMLLSLAACGAATQTEENRPERVNTIEGYDPDARWSGIYSDPQWDGSLPLVQPGEDNVITIGITNNPKVIDYDTNAYTLWLEEKTGVDIRFVSLGDTARDTAAQVNIMISEGEELPDLLALSGMGKDQLRELGQEGYFLNLAGYLATDGYYTCQALETYYGDRYNDIELHIRNTVMDPGSNAIYGFPNVTQNTADVLTAQMWINRTWLDNLGLTAPTNVDELYDVLVAFRDNDPNGNGLKDEIPMIGNDASQATDLIGWIINAYIYYNYKHRFNVENDLVYLPYDQDEYRQALIYIKKLVDEGLLTPMSWSASDSERMKALCPADNNFIVGITAASYDEGFETGHSAMYEYVPLAPLAAATPRGGYGPVSADKVTCNYQISADCHNPRLVFRLLDFMSSPEAYVHGRYGVEGVDWDYVAEDNTLPGVLGGEARLILLGDDPNYTVNNQIWHGQSSQKSRDYWQYAVDLGDGSWKSTQNLKMQQQLANYAAAGMPEQVFYEMCRSNEENDLYNEYNNDLSNFVKKTRAEFCNGLRDPEDDADWQKYLDKLYGLHYQEAWIDLAQASWDRTH